MRKALGKGLEALFPGPGEERERVASAPAAPAAPLAVSVRDIVANPEQPRRRFDEEALESLAGSIRRHGLLQPLVVRRTGARYELIAGERRLRAAVRAGLEAVPVLVREATTEGRLELALIENLQREDLNALEEAEAYRHLIDEYGLTQEEIAARVGKSRPAVTNALRLLSLPDAVKAQIESGELSAGHARAVLAVEDASGQVNFAREITARRLSKNEAERLAAARRPGKRARMAGAGTADIHLRGLAEELTRRLGTRVRIVRRGKGGVIEIEFYSAEELERFTSGLRVGGSAGASL
jgi:ParB family chromosome partitioning protein